MRDRLSSVLNTLVSSKDFASCAVVGGSNQEPEIQSLSISQGSVKTLGIEDCDQALDLNIEAEIIEQFHLVIRSQVLEHVWNLRAARKNLVGLTSDDGLLWINVPASNFVHGSPEYFPLAIAWNFCSETSKTWGG